MLEKISSFLTKHKRVLISAIVGISAASAVHSLETKLSHKIITEEYIPRQFRGDFESKMSMGEASKILDIPISASQKEIQFAHKKLLLINHPDKGGSTFLATKINEAKEKMDRTKGIVIK
ncbi:hypothetical protein ADUPG1_007758 [Aduncisulcus paluster]|uniref:J domain-containing protein n=1 Tax=Aduncisulcus paluster TaxID=2918883 RepID=A0ABQ5KPE9_9EUKA|nr:hypothetical protein ADUPG1_007758 [Aduncisulcus paluster]